MRYAVVRHVTIDPEADRGHRHSGRRELVIPAVETFPDSRRGCG
jgi:hypothetical protein